MPVTVLDRAPDVVMSPRAAVYHWAVREGLDRLGYEPAAARGFLKQDYEYRAHRTGERVRFGLQTLEGVVPRPYNLHLGQGALVRLMLAELAAYDSATVLWQHDVVAVGQDDAGVTVVAETPEGRRSLRALAARRPPAGPSRDVAARPRLSAVGGAGRAHRAAPGRVRAPRRKPATGRAGRWWRAGWRSGPEAGPEVQGQGLVQTRTSVPGTSAPRAGDH
ncbi:hypothetical protein ACI784_21170 [Geodermatophilus sp. SYSU D01186]